MFCSMASLILSITIELLSNTTAWVDLENPVAWVASVDPVDIKAEVAPVDPAA